MKNEQTGAIKPHNTASKNQNKQKFICLLVLKISREDFQFQIKGTLFADRNEHCFFIQLLVSMRFCCSVLDAIAQVQFYDHFHTGAANASGPRRPS